MQSLGLESTEEDFHVTLVYSKAAVDWRAVDQHVDTVTVTGGKRSVEMFGDNALVLRFESSTLQKQHADLLRAGCSSDYREYKPHITIAYLLDADADIDLDSIEPYTGDIVLGPEVFVEIPQPIMMEYDEAKHPRDERGRWTESGGDESSGASWVNTGREPPAPSDNRFLTELGSTYGEGRTWMQHGSKLELREQARDAVIKVGDGNFETLVIVGEHHPDGTLCGAAPQGKSDSVGVPEALMAQFRTYELHHNHPSDLPCSGPDIGLLNRHPGEMSVWAHTPSGLSCVRIPGRDAEHPNRQIVGPVRESVRDTTSTLHPGAFDNFLMQYHDKVAAAVEQKLNRLKREIERRYEDPKLRDDALMFVLYYPLVQGLVHAGLVEHDYKPGPFEKGLLHDHGRAIANIQKIADEVARVGIEKLKLRIVDDVNVG